MLWLATLGAALILGQRPAPAPAAIGRGRRASEAKHLKNIRQVTFGFAQAGEGYFRPDGKAIIFQAVPNLPALDLPTRRGRQRDDYQIFTADLAPDAKPEAGQHRARGSAPARYYHPDGKSILFASTHLEPARPRPGDRPKGPAYSRSEPLPLGLRPEGMDIFRADLDGKNLVRLTDAPGYDAEGSYSPDGKQIIFTSFRDGDAEIYIMDADGKNPRRITHAKGYDGGPFFSPDGKRIIYRSDRKENDLLQIYVNNPEGTAERALTDNDFVNWGPYLHPDSRHIIYATSRHGHQNYELYLMDVDTGARGADHLPRGLRRPAGLQPRRQAADVDLERPDRRPATASSSSPTSLTTPRLAGRSRDPGRPQPIQRTRR